MMLAVLAVIFVSTGVAAAAAASSSHPHPLDTLSAAELTAVRAAVLASPLVAARPLYFHYVGLDEPDKADVLSYAAASAGASSSTAPLPRRAFVIARADGQSHELLVDVTDTTTPAVLSHGVHHGAGFPMMTAEDQAAAMALPPTYPPFVESVRRRGLNVSDVGCGVISRGWFGDAQPDYGGGRVAKMQCSVTAGSANFYARPLEGVTLVVDLDRLAIVGYRDRVVEPVPKADGTEYRAEKLGPPFTGPATAPGVVVQPEGRGFRIDGNVVRVASSSMASGSSSLPQSPSSVGTQPESGNDSEPIEIEDDPEEDEINAGSKRKLTSAVWKEFKRVKFLGQVKAKCMYCGKKLSAKSTSGTKHLHDHLKGCPYRRSKLTGNNKNLTQSSLRFPSKESGLLSVENYSFDSEVARRELAAMIILHEYPLSMVDHTGFRRFVSALQPLFKMVSRNTIRKDIMDAYMEEKKKALEYMAGTKSRVAITTDMWTSENQKRGYMAVTAHFIDDSWTLRNIIMRFIYVPAPHTAEVISEQLYDALVEWNIDEKISTLTMDNCSTNDAVIPMLINKIGTNKLMLDGQILHMRCCAHILNLIVKDGLDVIQPAIAKIRDSVAFWIATPKRAEKLEEIAKYVKVPTDNKLGLDCKTRWNSTYKMLSVALPYEAAFNRATRVEKLFDFAPTKEDWAFAREVVGRLKMFDDITALFSGTSYVTANVQLFKICEAKTKIMNWSACGIPIIEEMSIKMIEKFDKYWKGIQGPMGIATILDPRFKTDYLLGLFECLFGHSCESCQDKVEAVKSSLYDLMIEYQSGDADDEGNTKSSAPSLDHSGFLSTISARVASRRPVGARFRTEQDRYLDDELVPIDSENFKILDWWKVAGTRYPTLRKIARDIFAIPVSTVASESAFSTSGRVLSEHRSRLTPEILEALMCSQDWMRRKYIDATNVDKPETFWSCLQEIQEGMQKLLL